MINNQMLTVLGVHLTSDRSQNSEQKRAAQISELHNAHIENSKHSVLVVGDFNFDDDENFIVKSAAPFFNSMQDVWSDLKGLETNPGLC